MNSILSWMKYPIAYFRLLFMLVLIAVFIYPARLINIFFKLNKHQRFTIRRCCFSILVPALGLKVKLFGADPIQKHSGKLVVSNHRSFVDPLVQLKYLCVLVLSKAEVKRYPVVGHGADITGILYFDRSNSKSRYNIRRTIHDALIEKMNVFLYPEGTTKNAKHTSKFHAGAIKEAIATKSKIIPIVIEYKDPRDNWVGNSFHDQFIYQLGKIRSDVGLWFGEPMFYEDPDEFIIELKKVMDNAIDEIHDYWARG